MKRVTRSQTVATKATGKAAPPPARSSTRNTAAISKEDKGTRKASSNVKPVRNTSAKRETKQQCKNKNNSQQRGRVENVRQGRGDITDTSFAPSEFKFSAPSGLKSFVFKPLSPASAAGFFSGKDVSAFAPSVRR